VTAAWFDIDGRLALAEDVRAGDLLLAATEALARASQANDDAVDALQAGDLDAEARALRCELGHLAHAAAYADAAGRPGWAAAIRLLADDVRASLVTDDPATPF
jgi:HAMP domain-containing protein